MSLKNKKIIAVIPARYGSTRLVGKPLIKIKGKTIVEYVYSNISSSKIIDEVIIATDDKRIYDAVESFGGKSVMTPLECPSGTDRIAYVMKLEGYSGYDIIANIQGDEPLIKLEDVENAVKLLIENNSDVSTLAVRISDLNDILNPNFVKVVMNKKSDALYFSRAPIPFSRDDRNFNSYYYKHIGVYIYTQKTLLEFAGLKESQLEKIEKLEQLRLLENSYRISVALTENNTIGLDTPDDLEKLEKYL